MLKLAGSGALTLCPAGCTVTTGATTDPVTVSVTAELKTLLPATDTTTRKRRPLSAALMTGVV